MARAVRVGHLRKPHSRQRSHLRWSEGRLTPLGETRTVISALRVGMSSRNKDRSSWKTGIPARSVFVSHHCDSQHSRPVPSAL
jgi:hypothetical protein